MPELAGTDPDRLRALLRDLPDATPALRVVCALAYLDGVSVGTLSDRYGVPESTVYDWLDRFEERPPAEAAAADDRGRPPALDDDERARLAACLERPPAAFDVDAEEWTAAAVQTLLAREFGVEYSRTHAWRLREAVTE